MAYVERTGRHDLRREGTSGLTEGAAGWLVLVAALIGISVFGATFNALADRPDWSSMGAASVGVVSGLLVALPLVIVALAVYVLRVIAQPRP